MKICECCGQEREFGGSSVICVDDQLLALCNRAHLDADSRRCAQVDIAHLVWCLAGWSSADHHFSNRSIRREDFAEAAYRWITTYATATSGQPPRTSTELKALLGRAQRLAAQQGRRFANLSDFIEILLYGAADLPTAQFVSWAKGPRADLAETTTSTRYRIGNASLPDCEINSAAAIAQQQHSAPAIVTHRAWVDDTLQVNNRPSAPVLHRQSEPDVYARQTTSVHSSYETSHATKPIDPDVKSLIERLDRQEKLLVEIQGHYVQLQERQKLQGVDAEQPGSHAPGSHTYGSISERANAEYGGRPNSTHAVRHTEPSADGGADQKRWNIDTRRRRWRRPEKPDVGAESPAEMPPRLPRPASVRASLSVVRNSIGHDEPCDDEAIDFVDSDGDDNGSDDASYERKKRFYLAPDDEIVRAPSIGQRTAARLIAIGIHRVRDLLRCNPAELATKSGSRFITAPRVVDWQAQSRLVCIVPWLRGTHAQLLVGAGYGKLEDIVNADSTVVWRAIKQFSTSRDGQSVLRMAPPPDIERVMQWVQNAALAEPARAA